MHAWSWVKIQLDINHFLASCVSTTLAYLSIHVSINDTNIVFDNEPDMSG